MDCFELLKKGTFRNNKIYKTIEDSVFTEPLVVVRSPTIDGLQENLEDNHNTRNSFTSHMDMVYKTVHEVLPTASLSEIRTISLRRCLVFSIINPEIDDH